jgi:L-amino acid N-acyltransferase YncA
MQSLARHATRDDCAAIARIYNEGIEERIATFETTHRSPADILQWLELDHPVVVVETVGKIAAFAAAHPYRARPCYDGVREFSVYVARDSRRQGAGLVALEALCAAAAARGWWKLLARIFVENHASRQLCVKAGFREVGVYVRHGRLDGVWRDCVIVEKLVGDAAV